MVGESWSTILNSLPLIHKQLVLTTSPVNVLITCGIQPTNAVTMEMKVLCNSCW